MKRIVIIVAATVLVVLGSGKLLLPADASSAAIASPDVHSWLWHGVPTATGATNPATVTVPAGQCFRVAHVDVNAEKSGGAYPDGGDLTVGIAVYLPGGNDETGLGSEIAGASTETGNRVDFEILDYTNLVLPPGTVLKVIVFVGYNYQLPLSNYYWFVTMIGEFIPCV